MIYPNNFGDTVAASAGNPELKQLLDNMVNAHVVTQQQLGATNLGTPPNAVFTVSGLDGTNIVVITNPEVQTFLSTAQARQKSATDRNAFRAAVYHQLQS